MKIIMACTLLLLCGASKCDSVPAIPPPVAKGKCLVDKYEADQAIQQTCVYVGYDWSCTWLRTSGIYECNRGAETVGERSVMKP